MLGLIASAFLFTMGILHLSGINYFKDLVLSSDLSPMIKDVFPVLFALPSLQLIGFSIVGAMEIFSRGDSSKVFRLLSLLVFLDAIVAVYLGVWLPAILLFIPAGLFLILCYRK